MIELELDPVTGLPFVLHLQQHVRDFLQSHDRLLVCYLDCTNLTEWNDAHGWTGGDRLLRVFAERFAADLDPRFEVVRLMGDVFAVCEAAGPEVDPAAEASMVHALADRLMAKASDGRVGFRLIWHVFTRSEIDAVDKGCRLLENAARSHRERTAVVLPPSAFLPGVGDRLHDLIAWVFGQSAVDGCGCKPWIVQMNDWGSTGCRKHLDEIVDHLVKVATERDWTLSTAGADPPLADQPAPQTFRLRVARLAARAVTRAPFGESVVREVCREMVLAAIAKSEAQQNA